MTRVRRVRRLMNAVWRLVRTFWPKKKCHHMRTFSKVLKLMALFESSYVTACPWFRSQYAYFRIFSGAFGKLMPGADLYFRSFVSQKSAIGVTNLETTEKSRGWLRF